jgi:hypothetical protein
MANIVISSYTYSSVKSACSSCYWKLENISGKEPNYSTVSFHLRAVETRKTALKFEHGCHHLQYAFKSTSCQTYAMRDTLKKLIRKCAIALLFPSVLWRALRTSSRNTDYNRWKKNITTKPPWDERNKAIAALIPAGSRVIDVGAGSQSLKMHLGEACDYQPCDLIQSSPDCLLCDFNRNVYPVVQCQYDYVIVSGVLEYIEQPREFIGRIVRYGHFTLLSYKPWDGRASGKLRRLSEGWVSHLRESDLETIFAELSIDFSRATTWQGHIIYHLNLL